MIIRTETEAEPPRRVVRLVGRFDAHETAGFRSTVHPLLSAEDSVVHLDLSQVAFVDSTALAELVRLQKAARALDGQVVLERLSDPVRVILEITDLAGLFTVVDAAPDAP